MTTAAAINRDPERMRERIIEVLSMYPVISPTMLYISVGYYLPRKVWRSALDNLIADGTVIRQKVRMGITKRPSIRLQLADNKYWSVKCTKK